VNVYVATAPFPPLPPLAPTKLSKPLPPPPPITVTIIVEPVAPPGTVCTVVTDVVYKIVLAWGDTVGTLNADPVAAIVIVAPFCTGEVIVGAATGVTDVDAADTTVLPIESLPTMTNE
jgi:hypothetical protein